jgi:hypothetical protein
MPDRIEHDDLERAFEAFADVAGISTRQRAFRRALKILDDSFIRTYHDRDHIFVVPYDPSVADFLAEYVRSSPADARLLVRGAIFFEQIESLSRMLPARDLAGQTASEYLDAVERCLNANSCTWHDVYFGPHATEPTTIRHRARLEQRIDFVGRVKTWRGAYREESLKTRVRAIYAAGKDRVRDDWMKLRGDPEEAVQLLGGMRRRREGIQAYALAAKTLITDGVHYPYAFSHLLALRDLAPSIFSEPEWAALRRRYLEVADDELTNWHEMRSIDQLDDLEHYAERMGVQLDTSVLKETRLQVEQAIAEAEDRALEGAEDDEPETHEPDGGEAEIEALFTSLANQ